MAEETHETKIVISGDAKNAVGAFGSVVGALNKVRTAVSRVMMAFSVFGMAIQGIQVLISWYKKLEEWINRTARAATQMRVAAAFKTASNAMDDLIRKQSIYNKLLQEELADLQRQNELRGIKQNNRYKKEDTQREIDRANEMAGVTDPETRRKIEQRWRVEDEQRSRAREGERLGKAISDENEKSAIYGSKAGANERAAAEARKEADALMRSWYQMTDEQKKEAEAQKAALIAKAKALEESAAKYRIEEKQAEARAELYRQEAEDLRTAPSVAKAKNAAEDIQVKAEQEKKAQSNAEAELQRTTKEAERQHAKDEARAQAEENREKEKRAGDLEAFAGRIDAADGVSGNRLTAMGLGSGVSAKGGVASDVRKLVELVRQDVEANKKSAEKSDNSLYEMVLGE